MTTAPDVFKLDKKRARTALEWAALPDVPFTLKDLLGRIKHQFEEPGRKGQQSWPGGDLTQWLCELFDSNGLPTGARIPDEDETWRPEITAEWCPVTERDGAKIAGLVADALGAGILGRHPGAGIAFEHLPPDGDDDEYRYRWLFTVWEPSPLIVASPSFPMTNLGNDVGGGEMFPVGAEAVLGVLREAVAAGNDLFAGLDIYHRARTEDGDHPCHP